MSARSAVINDAHALPIMNSKERPILMAGEMVRATLDGRKTQARRIANLPLHWSVPPARIVNGRLNRYGMDSSESVPVPYQVGMKLWVRETFALENTYEYHGDHEIPTDVRPVQKHESEDWGYWLIPRYRATEPDTLLLIKETERPEDAMRWTPSIHMPRWASRITLEITNVRVERVQDISEEDAKAEGVELLKPGFYRAYDCKEGFATTAKRSFETLWTSIYGPDSWSANPLIWVLEFRQFPLTKTGEG